MHTKDVLTTELALDGKGFKTSIECLKKASAAIHRAATQSISIIQSSIGLLTCQSPHRYESVVQ